MEMQIETNAQVAWLDGEGILRAKAKPGTNLTLEDAHEVIQKLGVLCAGRRRPILVDLTGTKSMSREARTYFSGPETAKVQSAAALLINSPLGRAIGNFFMGLNKTLIPARLFTSEAEALEWLRGFLE
jgi:hypothetical protein